MDVSRIRELYRRNITTILDLQHPYGANSTDIFWGRCGGQATLFGSNKRLSEITGKSKLATNNTLIVGQSKCLLKKRKEGGQIIFMLVQFTTSRISK